MKPWQLPTIISYDGCRGISPADNVLHNHSGTWSQSDCIWCDTTIIVVFEIIVVVIYFAITPSFKSLLALSQLHSRANVSSISPNGNYDSLFWKRRSCFCIFVSFLFLFTCWNTWILFFPLVSMGKISVLTSFLTPEKQNELLTNIGSCDEHGNRHTNYIKIYLRYKILSKIDLNYTIISYSMDAWPLSFFVLYFLC